MQLSNRLAIRSATEDNVSYWCAGRFRPDMKPKPFDHRDEYQQFEICSKARDVFIAKPVVPHTPPPPSPNFPKEESEQAFGCGAMRAATLWFNDVGDEKLPTKKG
ncbi:hypothetical protein V6N13_014145 [Hibiscus sabdariffa]